jgi:hypothetical protein
MRKNLKYPVSDKDKIVAFVLSARHYGEACSRADIQGCIPPRHSKYVIDWKLDLLVAAFVLEGGDLEVL